MKLSKVFAAAKEFLTLPSEVGNNNKLRCICYAIDRVRGPEKDTDRAHDIIWGRLGDHSFLEGWVSEKVGWGTLEDYREANGDHEFRKKMQATRHAWLDALVIEFAAKGD